MFGQYSDACYKKGLKWNFSMSEKIVRREKFVVLSCLPDCGLDFCAVCFLASGETNSLFTDRRQNVSTPTKKAGELIVLLLDWLWVCLAFVF